MDFDFVGVEGDGLGRSLDVQIDINLPLVRPWLACFKVEEGDIIVGRFDTDSTSQRGSMASIFGSQSLTHPTGYHDLKPS